VRRAGVAVVLVLLCVASFALGRATEDADGGRSVQAPPLLTTDDLASGGPTAVITGRLVPTADCVALDVGDPSLGSVRYLTVWPSSAELTFFGIDLPEDDSTSGFLTEWSFSGGLVEKKDSPKKYEQAISDCTAEGVAFLTGNVSPRA
jgi:hypothetical protein